MNMIIGQVLARGQEDHWFQIQMTDGDFVLVVGDAVICTQSAGEGQAAVATEHQVYAIVDQAISVQKDAAFSGETCLMYLSGDTSRYPQPGAIVSMLFPSAA